MKDNTVNNKTILELLLKAITAKLFVEQIALPFLKLTKLFIHTIIATLFFLMPLMFIIIVEKIWMI